MNVKLTPQEVAQILKYRQEGYSQQAIADAFKVSQTRISQILRQAGVTKPTKIIITK
ncbi:MAG: helix-turn-helix domain-containing protein [Aeromonas veronii]